MQLLYEYHELVEQDSSAVSGFWKVFQIFIYMMASALGISCTVLLYVLVMEFDMNCILNPKLIVMKTEESNLDGNTKHYLYENETAMVDFIQSQWADMDVCHLPLFNPIISAISGIIWTVFFMMCAKGGKSTSGLVRPWRILAPAFTFTLIYSIFCLVVSQKTHSGLTSFSHLFENATQSVEIGHFSGTIKIKAYVTACLATSWLYTACWISALFLLCIRCCFAIDFKVMQVRVELIGEPGEENVPVTVPNNKGKNVFKQFSISPPGSPDSLISDDNSFAPLIGRRSVAFKSTPSNLLNEPHRAVDLSDGGKLKTVAQMDNKIPTVTVHADVEPGTSIGIEKRSS